MPLDDQDNLRFDADGKVITMSRRARNLFNGQVAQMLLPKIDTTDPLFFLLNQSNLTTIFGNISTAASALIRNNATGDNRDLTMAPGRAFYNEVYFHVRWQWLLLPLLEILLAIVFLVMLMFWTQKEPLLKTSQIGLLMYGLEGYKDEELLVKEPKTAEALERLAKEMTVILEENREGRVTFAKSDKTVSEAKTVVMLQDEA